MFSGADVNRLHGTLLPLHCACMVSDSYILRLLLQKGARVSQAPHKVIKLLFMLNTAEHEIYYAHKC